MATDPTDPIHQFAISRLVPIEIGGLDFSFTNSTLFMVLTVGVAAAFLYYSTRGRGLVPSKLQSITELTYEFTFALAMTVIAVVVGYGIAKHGLSWFKVFVPSGVPGAILPFVVLIEVISFLSRPVSLSVRLFANMLAGHITLKVFAGFVVTLSSLGAVGIIGAILPLLMTVAITALEFLVAFLQAYVFAVLTCMYLNDAVHPHH